MDHFRLKTVSTFSMSATMIRCSRAPAIASLLLISGLTGCSDDGISTADLQAVAKERVTRQLGLTADAALFTNTFVSQPETGELEGELVLCGTVEGERADGTAIAPHKFIAATDPGRWVRFDAAGQLTDRPINMAADWATACAEGEKIK